MDRRIKAMLGITAVLIIIGAAILPPAFEKGQVDTVPIRLELVEGDYITYVVTDYSDELEFYVTYTVEKILEDGYLKIKIEENGKSVSINMKDLQFRSIFIMNDLISVISDVESIITPFGEYKCQCLFTVGEFFNYEYWVDSNYLIVSKIVFGHDSSYQRTEALYESSLIDYHPN